jgi:hypothetical protein
MSNVTTEGTFKDRFVYIVLTILFLIASIFCFINGVEFVNLRKNDPDGELEINTSYTIFLIIMNFFFAFVTLFFVVIFCLKAVNPRGQGWADKIINKFKVMKRDAKEKSKDIDDFYIANYKPTIEGLINTSIKLPSEYDINQSCGSIRGPKIIFTTPQDTQISVPSLNDPIKRISLGDFLPYSVTKQQRAENAINAPKPITLENLKNIYLSGKGN